MSVFHVEQSGGLWYRSAAKGDVVLRGLVEDWA